MATYKTKQELEGKTLEKDDVVTFTVKGESLHYIVYSNPYWFLQIEGKETDNALIFYSLGINKKDFIESISVCVYTGNFPYHKNPEDLTKTTLALFSECEKLNNPKGVVDLSIIPEWKIGDIVWFNDWWVVSGINLEQEYELICRRQQGSRVFKLGGYYPNIGLSRGVLTQNEALLCFGVIPTDDILTLSSEIKAENEPEIEELVSVQLTKNQYDKLLTLLNR